MDDRDTSAAQAEVAQLVSELIAIDSSNYGNDEGPGEVAAADYVFQRLVEVGLEPERYSTTSDRRQGVVVRLPGRDRTRGALLLHGLSNHSLASNCFGSFACVLVKTEHAH